MSQIIQKFQEGGTTPTLFKWNQGGIETDRLVKAISTNIDSYLDEQDWSVKRKERFVNSVNKFITGIENGNITEMSPTGKFLDSRGIEGGGVSNETGNNRFREDREAASFVKWVLNGQTPYQKPEKKVEPFDINKSFAKSFNKKYLNNTSDTFNLEALSNVSYNYRNNLIYPIFEALRNVDSEDWGDYGNKQNYLAAVERASNQYEKAHKAGFKDDTDAAKTIISALSGLNINSGFLRSWFSTIDGLFSTPTQVQTQSGAQPTANTTTDTSTQASEESSPSSTPIQSTTDTSYESLLFYPSIQNLWKIDQKTNIKLPANRWINSKGYKQRIGPQFTGSDNYLAKLFQHVVTLDSKDWSNSAKSEYQVPYWDSKTATWKMNYNNTYKELMGDAINYMLQTNNSDLLKLNDGSVVIGSTINVKYPVCLAYNPSTKELKRVPIYLLMNEPNVSPKIKEQLANSSTTVNVSSTPNIWSHKEGGSIKKYQTPAGPLNFDFDKYGKYVKFDTSKRYRLDLQDDGTVKLVDRAGLNAIDDNHKGFYRPEGNVTEVEKKPWFKNWTDVLTTNPDIAEAWSKGYVDHNQPYGKKYENAWSTDRNFDFNKFSNTKFLGGNANASTDKNAKFLWYDTLNGPGHDVFKGLTYHIKNDKGEDEFGSREDFEKLGYVLPDDAEENPTNNPLVYYKTLIKKTPETETKSETPKTGEKQNSSVDPIIHSDKDLNFDWESWAIPFAGSTLRYLNTERANKQMLNEALNSYKPYYKDPKRFERNIYGDYGALSNSENEAQQINTKASNSTYSDAQIQAAKELEGEKVAAVKRAEGQRAYSNKIQTTQEATLAQAKENDYNAIDTTNENRYNQWNTNMLKSQARQGYISRRAQNLNTFLQELQMQAQNRLDKKLNLDEKALDAYIKAKYSNNPELLALQRDAQQWVAQGNDLNNWDTAKYNRLVSLQNELAFEEMKFRLENTGKLYGIGVNKQLLNKIKVNSNPIQVNQVPIQSNKSGGTLSEENKLKISKMKHQLEKQKLFQKNIRESINDNSKMINNLSNTMQKLLMQVIK